MSSLFVPESESQWRREVGIRLRLTRLAVGLSQNQLAKVVGTTREAVSNWERGERLADTFGMVKFCSGWRVPLDWIYMGSMSGLPGDVARKMWDHAMSRPEFETMLEDDLSGQQ